MIILSRGKMVNHLDGNDLQNIIEYLQVFHSIIYLYKLDRLSPILGAGDTEMNGPISCPQGALT